MDPVVAYLGILGALGLGVISPGPSFVLVARTAIAASRAEGVAAAVGMGIGGIGFAALALLGLQAVIAEVPWLYLGARLAGALYLIHLAVRLWRGAPTPLALPVDGSSRGRGWTRALGLGLATQLSNPKTAIVYGSVFAALLPAAPPGWLVAALLPAIFLLETGWYVAIALGFSAARPRAAYLGAKTRIDRLAAVVMGALGARLLVEALRTAAPR